MVTFWWNIPWVIQRGGAGKNRILGMDPDLGMPDDPHGIKLTVRSSGALPFFLICHIVGFFWVSFF